jgi:phosphate-selective porin OprO/OprP
VQGGFFITGESRNYDPKSGKYKRIMPTRKYWGAWEIAARYSKLDLQDRDVLGGREGDVTVALNWWANAMVMLRFNYVYADLSPNSAQTLQGVPEQAHVFSGRAQIVF